MFRLSVEVGGLHVYAEVRMQKAERRSLKSFLNSFVLYAHITHTQSGQPKERQGMLQPASYAS